MKGQGGPYEKRLILDNREWLNGTGLMLEREKDCESHTMPVVQIFGPVPKETLTQKKQDVSIKVSESQNNTKSLGKDFLKVAGNIRRAKW